MEIRLEEMREIARILPIGYYLGRKVPVLVEPGDGAYCNVVTGEIHIGIGLLQQAAWQIDAADAAQWSREKLLRCLLYHECGHVLLTPEWLKECWNYPETPDGGRDPDGAELLNCFEDERLEQMLSRFFLGVDFKGFVRLVHKRGVKDSRVGKFLKAVRLRQTTPEVSAAVDAAVQKLVWCDSQSNYFEHCADGKQYKDVLTELVNMIAPYSKPEEQQPQQQQPQSSDGEPKPEQEQPKDEKPDGGSEDKPDENKPPEQDKSEEQQNSEDDKPEDDKSDDKPDADKSDEDDKPDAEDSIGREPAEVKLPGDFLKSLADKVFVTPPSDVENTLKRFAVRLSKRKGAQAAGRWSALHGRIDARRDALDKERIFRRTSDIGACLMSSVHLTLWVDCSGSFYSSKEVLNQILAATSKAMLMSSGKLTVDLVKMTSSACVAEQSQWTINPCGPNAINESFAEAWRKTRRKDRRNIDLVVFDGVCAKEVYVIENFNRINEQAQKIKAAGGTPRLRGCKGGMKGLKEKASAALPVFDGIVKIASGIWDSPDCHVISDLSNKMLFDKLGKAHVTYVDGNYAEQLQSKVMETLDRIL